MASRGGNPKKVPFFNAVFKRRNCILPNLHKFKKQLFLFQNGSPYTFVTEYRLLHNVLCDKVADTEFALYFGRLLCLRAFIPEKQDTATGMIRVRNKRRPAPSVTKKRKNLHTQTAVQVFFVYPIARLSDSCRPLFETRPRKVCRMFIRFAVRAYCFRCFLRPLGFLHSALLRFLSKR